MKLLSLAAALTGASSIPLTLKMKLQFFAALAFSLVRDEKLDNRCTDAMLKTSVGHRTINQCVCNVVSAYRRVEALESSSMKDTSRFNLNTAFLLRIEAAG